MPWQPARIDSWFEASDVFSTGVARVETDAGEAFLKALGNAQGPHALVREWVGTSVARWLGLTTFDFAIVTVAEGQELPLGKGGAAQPGPAFVTRAEKGNTWSGNPEELKQLVNPEDLTRLLIADTWLLNADRFPPAGNLRQPNYYNVFLSIEGLKGNRKRLVAMDFSDCIKPTVSLTPRIADIGNIKDERLFGLFPAFREHLQRLPFDQSLARLQQATAVELEPVIAALPEAWEVSRELRDALVRFLVQRACYLVEHLPTLLGDFVQEQMDFTLNDG